MRKIMIIFIIFYINTFAYINVYPLSFDQRIDGMGALKDYVLTNNTGKTLKYLIKLDKSDSKLDMTDWGEIYPKSVVLRSGEEKEVKLYIHSPKKISDGEYSTILNIKELEVPSENISQEKLKVFTNLKLKIYGYVGDLESSISVKDLKISKGRCKGELKIFGKLKNESLRRIKLEVILKGKEQEYLISECKLKMGEEIELKNLKLLTEKLDINEKEYRNLDRLCIYEKESGKLLIDKIIVGS